MARKSSTESRAASCLKAVTFHRKSVKMFIDSKDKSIAALKQALYFSTAAENHLNAITLAIREDMCRLGEHEFGREHNYCLHCPFNSGDLKD